MAISNCIIGLQNPKDPSNMGSILRTAGCFQASEIRYTGARLHRALKYSTDTQNVQNRIDLWNCGELLEEIPPETKVVAVELVTGATPLPMFAHPKNAIYIFGPEDGSLSQSLVNEADHVVYIPTVGCLNLAATVNVVLYDRQAKLGGVIASNETIASSRDRNNNLKA